MADLPRYQPRAQIADIGVVRTDTRGVGAEWGALAVAANQIGDTAARQALADREFAARLEAAQQGVVRDAAGNLTLPSFDLSTVEGKAGAAQALKGYEAQFSLDVKTRAQTFAAEALARNDPNHFNTAWQAYSEQTLETAPKATQGLAKTILESTGRDFAANIYIKQLEQQQQLTVGNLTALNTQAEQDLYALANIGQGASPKAQGLLLNYKSNLEALVGMGRLGADQAKVAVEGVEREMGVQAFMGNVRAMYDEGRAKQLTPATIRAQVQDFVEKAVRDPEFKATVEQRAAMHARATAYVEMRTATENLRISEVDKAMTERVTTSLIDLRMREREALRAGNGEALSQLQSEYEKLITEAGKHGTPAVAALFALDGQIARLEKDASTKANEAFEAFIKSQDGNQRVRQALAGIVDDKADRPLIEAAIADHNSKNGTSLTYDEVAAEVRRGVNPADRVGRAERMLSTLKPSVDAVRKQLDIEMEMQGFLAHGGPLRQETLDGYAERHSDRFRQNPAAAASFYAQANAIPSIETRVFQAGRTNSAPELVRSTAIYDRLPEHLKAKLPERAFWEYMSANLRGMDTRDPEKVDEITKLARSFNQQTVAELPGALVDASRSAVAPGGDGEPAIRSALTKWADGQRSILERADAAFDFTGKMAARQAIERLPDGPLPAELRSEIANRAARYRAETGSLIGQSQALELATTDTIEKGGWRPSLMASATGKPTWVRHAPEAGFTGAGLTGGDTTRYLTRLIDTSDHYAGRTSTYSSFGREMVDTGRTVVRPAFGPDVDPSRGYAFELYVKDDNGLWSPVTQGGGRVFYATRADSLYSAVSDKYARSADEFIKEVEANYRDAFGRDMPAPERELWSRFSGFVGQRRADVDAFTRWMADYRANASPARAQRAWDLALAEFMSRLEGGPGVYTDPKTGGRGRPSDKGTR